MIGTVAIGAGALVAGLKSDAILTKVSKIDEILPRLDAITSIVEDTNGKVRKSAAESIQETAKKIEGTTSEQTETMKYGSFFRAR